MPQLDCPHQTTTETRLICVHLLEAINHDDTDEDFEFFKYFTGIGKEYSLICDKCHQTPLESSANIRTVCLKCFQEAEGNRSISEWIGNVGKPQILERATNLSFTHTVIELDSLMTDNILDIQPIETSFKPIWVALTKAGNLIQINFESQEISHLANLPESKLNLDEKISLHLSPEGKVAAVVNTKGSHGIVIDLSSGKMTMPLYRGNYHIEHCVFSIAFFTHEGRLLLVHATEWNRLDISDPLTGELITDRPSPRRVRDTPIPEHYLDYFHCGLLVSPDQEWIIDNGWVWHPVGIIYSWSLHLWLAENVWESEDRIRKNFCRRDNYWDGPICWISNNTLAIWGYGEYEYHLVAAVRLFDIPSGKEIRWFVGPTGDLVFDVYLFSFGKEYGASVWDIETGERLLLESEFCPTGYHRGAKQFLTVLPDGKFQLSHL